MNNEDRNFFTGPYRQKTSLSFLFVSYFTRKCERQEKTGKETDSIPGIQMQVNLKGSQFDRSSFKRSADLIVH